MAIIRQINTRLDRPKSTNFTKILDNGKISRGNFIFVISEALFIKLFVAALMADEVKVQGTKAVNKYRE